MGSFLACIWAAICSSTLAGETWWGRAVMTMAPFSRLYTARALMLPRPVSYRARMSSGGVTISASEGKSGPLRCAMMSSNSALGESSR